VRDVQQIKRGRWVAMLFTLLVDFSAVSIGVLGRFIFTSQGMEADAVLGNGAQNVLPELVEYTFPPWIVGLYVAAVLSAIMSTVSSLLVMSAGSITHDYYAKMINPNLTNQRAASLCRMVTISMAILALALAITISILSPDRTIFWFAIFGWSGIAATFCPMMVLSLFWPGFTEKAAIASMITGFSMTMISKFVLQEMDTMPPSFFSALIVGYVVALIWPDKELARLYVAELAALPTAKESSSNGADGFVSKPQ
jgi:sodium/proline symporter